MKNRYIVFLLLTFAVLSVSAFGQTSVVINVPGAEPVKSELSAAEQELMDKNVLPKVRTRLVGDACEETIEVAGILHGAFSKAGADQTLIFYQFCQTGNGLGYVGLALVENGKVIGNYVADVGWSTDAKVLPDINQNGLNEFELYYSGGMHQGSFATGVDIVEFTSSGLKGIGWFQAESSEEDSDYISYKVTVKPGKIPVFFREKYVSTPAGKWRKAGAIVPLQLTKVVGEFEAVK